MHHESDICACIVNSLLICHDDVASKIVLTSMGADYGVRSGMQRSLNNRFTRFSPSPYVSATVRDASTVDPSLVGSKWIEYCTEDTHSIVLYMSLPTVKCTREYC